MDENGLWQSEDDFRLHKNRNEKSNRLIITVIYTISVRDLLKLLSIHFEIQFSLNNVFIFIEIKCEFVFHSAFVSYKHNQRRKSNQKNGENIVRTDQPYWWFLNNNIALRGKIYHAISMDWRRQVNQKSKFQVLH